VARNAVSLGNIFEKTTENYGRRMASKPKVRTGELLSFMPCPSTYYRNSTNCNPVVIPPHPAPPDRSVHAWHM